MSFRQNVVNKMFVPGSIFISVSQMLHLEDCDFARIRSSAQKPNRDYGLQRYQETASIKKNSGDMHLKIVFLEKNRNTSFSVSFGLQ